MIEPAKIDDGVPAVTLAGKRWPVPKLAVRQMRRVRAPLIEMNERVRAAVKSANSEDERLTAASSVVLSLSEEEYESLFLSVVFWGLKRAHPDMTFDEFLDLEADEDDLTVAWYVVRNQSGLFVATPADGGTPEGEANGATQSPSQTGTD
jgi:hypothetical protein